MTDQNNPNHTFVSQVNVATVENPSVSEDGILKATPLPQAEEEKQARTDVLLNPYGNANYKPFPDYSSGAAGEPTQTVIDTEGKSPQELEHAVKDFVQEVRKDATAARNSEVMPQALEELRSVEVVIGPEGKSGSELVNEVVDFAQKTLKRATDIPRSVANTPADTLLSTKHLPKDAALKEKELRQFVQEQMKMDDAAEALIKQNKKKKKAHTKSELEEWVMQNCHRFFHFPEMLEMLMRFSANDDTGTSIAKQIKAMPRRLRALACTDNLVEESFSPTYSIYYFDGQRLEISTQVNYDTVANNAVGAFVKFAVHAGQIIRLQNICFVCTPVEVMRRRIKGLVGDMMKNRAAVEEAGDDYLLPEEGYVTFDSHNNFIVSGVFCANEQRAVKLAQEHAAKREERERTNANRHPKKNFSRREEKAVKQNVQHAKQNAEAKPKKPAVVAFDPETYVESCQGK